jgi:hypothetical protein
VISSIRFAEFAASLLIQLLMSARPFDPEELLAEPRAVLCAYACYVHVGRLVAEHDKLFSQLNTHEVLYSIRSGECVVPLRRGGTRNSLLLS